MRLGTRREPALVLLFIFLTCGLYYLYFIYKASQETDDFLGTSEISPGMEVVLSVVTCGLYNLYWDYKIGKRVAEMCPLVGLPVTDNAVLYLVLDFLGAGGFASVGLLNPLIQQDSLNRIWQAAMSGPPPVPGSSDPNVWPPAPQSYDPTQRTPRQPRPPQS